MKSVKEIAQALQSPVSHLPSSAPRRRVRFVLENVSEEDARFLGDVLALFADPALAHQVRRLRLGLADLHYGAHGAGMCCERWKRS